MKILTFIPFMVLLFLNCYLTDLEEYKHLEKHENDYIQIDNHNYYTIDVNGNINHVLSIKLNFTIKRMVQYEFFVNGDTTKKTEYIKMRDGNKSEFSPGTHCFGNLMICEPMLCANYITIRIKAASDIDTIKSDLQIQKGSIFHCVNGDVDSINYRIGFGDDTTYNSHVNASVNITENNFRYTSNMYIVSKFSRTYNRPYFMVYDLYKSANEIDYNFINPKNTNLISTANAIYYEFFDYDSLIGNIDRYVLCNIWKKNCYKYPSNTNVSTIHEVKVGKKYILSYFEQIEDRYWIFLLDVRNIVYNRSQSGYIDCVLYSLN